MFSKVTVNGKVSEVEPLTPKFVPNLTIIGDSSKFPFKMENVCVNRLCRKILRGFFDTIWGALTTWLGGNRCQSQFKSIRGTGIFIQPSGFS